MKTQDIQRDGEGNPLIASYFAGAHGYCGEVLLGNGYVRYCPRTFATREMRERDMVFDSTGNLFPASIYYGKQAEVSV